MGVLADPAEGVPGGRVEPMPSFPARAPLRGENDGARKNSRHKKCRRDEALAAHPEKIDERVAVASAPRQLRELDGVAGLSALFFRADAGFPFSRPHREQTLCLHGLFGIS